MAHYSLSLCWHFWYFQTHHHHKPADVFLFYLEEYPGIIFDIGLIWVEHYNLGFCIFSRLPVETSDIFRHIPRHTYRRFLTLPWRIPGDSIWYWIDLRRPLQLKLRISVDNFDIFRHIPRQAYRRFLILPRRMPGDNIWYWIDLSGTLQPKLLLTLLTFPHYSLRISWLFWYFQTHPTTRLQTFSYITLVILARFSIK